MEIRVRLSLAFELAVAFEPIGRLVNGALFLGTVTDPEKIQLLFALVLLPMTMLGCVYYSWLR